MDIGKKIVVVGISAVGKSTFSRELSQKLNLPLTLMDSIMWKSGWEYIGDEETVRELHEISQLPEWIIEGYISKGARTFVFDLADTIIYLDYSATRFFMGNKNVDYSPAICSWRYIKRWWRYRNNPRPELEGCPEKFSFKFLKLVWTKGEARSLNAFLEKVKNKEKIIVLSSPKMAADFLKKF